MTDEEKRKGFEINKNRQWKTQEEHGNWWHSLTKEEQDLAVDQTRKEIGIR